EINALPFKNAFCQIFKIYLVNDSDSRRYDAETAERLSSPLEKAVPLLVPLELHFHVALISRLAARKIDLHRMIDDQIDRNKRFYNTDILSHSRNRRAHCCQ